VTAGRMVLFSGVVVTAGRHGPGSGDGGGGGQEGSGVVPTLDQELDGAVLRLGGKCRAVWTWRRCGGGRGGSGVDSVASKRAWEILLPDEVQDKILWLWFKDKADGIFIGGPQ
jgi:hypothetical protein